MKKLKDILNESVLGELPSSKMFKYNKETGKYEAPNSIKEIHNPRSNQLFNKLVATLQTAVKQAEICGKDAKKNRDSGDWEGSEGNDLSLLLEEIYAAFMTGNHKDKSYNDEIFK